jgi:hypothetical protein
MNRRQFLATGVATISTLSGCSTSTSRSTPPTESTTESSTPTPTRTPRIPSDPIYSEPVNGDLVQRNHTNAINEAGGQHFVATKYRFLDQNDELFSQEGLDSITRWIYNYNNKHPGYDLDKSSTFRDSTGMYQYVLNKDGSVEYENPQCGYGMTSVYQEILNNATFAFNGIEELFGVNVQRYDSRGTEMLDESGMADLLYSSGVDFDLWSANLWIDKNRIVRKVSYSYRARGSNDESNILERSTVFELPSVGRQNISEPDWLNNAKATIEGTNCEGRTHRQ